MLATYRRVLSRPGALAFSATGLVARLPIAMMTLGIVLLVSTLTGSYAVAGQVSAAYVVGNAVFAIPHGRLADRFGQGRVLYADAVAFGLTTALMIVAIRDDWAFPWPHLWAALSGATISQIGTLVRARWAHLLELDAERHTAFALEGVLDEVVFVTGPALVTFLSTLVAPEAGLVAALLLGSGGAVVLAGQRATEPPAHPPSTGTRPAMPWRMLVPLACGAVAFGALFGGLEVSTVAVAEQAGHRPFSGVMLAAFALGSGIAGAAAGAFTWRRTPVQRARIGMWLLAAGALLPPLLGARLALVTTALFVTGLALAPTLIALFATIEAATPRSRLNEAMGFVQTGIGAGIAPGAWLAGVLADEVSGSASYWVGAVAALLAALAGLAVPEVSSGHRGSTGMPSAPPSAV